MTPLLALLVPLLAGQAEGQSVAKPAGGDAAASAMPAASANAPSPEGDRARGSNPNPTPSQTANPSAPPPVSAEQQAIAALGDRLAALESDLAAAREERARDAARIQELEGELARERERRAVAEGEPRVRGEALSGASGALAGADDALASGSSAGVGAALDDAATLAAETQAHAQRSPVEAALARDAQRYLADAQSALGRGDLFQARQSTSLALDAVARARSMNSAATGR